MVRFRFISAFLFVVMMAASPARSQILIRLGEAGDQDITLYQGDTRVDTVFLGGAATINSMSYPKQAPLVFTPFEKTPFTLANGWWPIGILTTTGSGRESFFFNYRTANGTGNTQFDVRSDAYPTGGKCLSMDSVEHVDSVKLYEFRTVSLDISNSTQRPIVLDSVTMQSATPQFFHLGLSNACPCSMLNFGSTLTANVGFWTQGLSVAPGHYDATLNGYAHGCSIASSQIRVTTKSNDTTYNPYRNAFFFIGDGVTHRILLFNNTGTTTILPLPRTNDGHFRIIGMSFTADTIVQGTNGVDTIVRDSAGYLDTSFVVHYQHTLVGHTMQAGDSVWLDIQFLIGHDTVGQLKIDSIENGMLVIDSIDEPNRMLYGMRTGTEAVSPPQAAPPARLLVRYDAGGLAHVESPTLGTLEIFDLLGRKLRQYPPAAAWTLTDLPGGNYIVRVSNADGGGAPYVESAKVIVGVK